MTSPYTGASAAGAAGAHAGDTQTIPTVDSQSADRAAHGNYTVAPGQQPTASDAGRPDVENTSVGELIGEVTRDLSTLMRQELELAKAELKAEAKKAGQGAGMFGVAGFSGYMVLLFLSIALMWGLANVMDVGWAGLIVAALWAVIGAVSFVMGRNRFQQVHPKPERTVDTLQRVPEALKPH
jgi:hypothetical protein